MNKSIVNRAEKYANSKWNESNDEDGDNWILAHNSYLDGANDQDQLNKQNAIGFINWMTTVDAIRLDATAGWETTIKRFLSSEELYELFLKEKQL